MKVDRKKTIKYRHVYRLGQDAGLSTEIQRKTEAALWVRKGHRACCSLSVIDLRVGWLEGNTNKKLFIYIYKNI